MVSHGSKIGFHGFLVVPGWLFIISGEFSWVFMVPGWFFMVPGGFHAFSWRVFTFLSWFQEGFHVFSWFQVGFHGSRLVENP